MTFILESPTSVTVIPYLLITIALELIFDTKAPPSLISNVPVKLPPVALITQDKLTFLALIVPSDLI